MTWTQRPWRLIRPRRRRSPKPTPRLDQTDTQCRCLIVTSIKSRTTVRRTTCHSLKSMTSTRTTLRPTCRSISKQRQQSEIIKRQVWVRCSVEDVQDLASSCYHVVLAKHSLASLRLHTSRSQHWFFAARTRLLPSGSMSSTDGQTCTTKKLSTSLPKVNERCSKHTKLGLSSAHTRWSVSKAREAQRLECDWRRSRTENGACSSLMRYRWSLQTPSEQSPLKFVHTAN